MRNATELMISYARYHRDRRNIATHFIGVPLIIFAISVLLSRPTFSLGGIALSPAWLLWGVTSLWYLTRGHWLLALATLLTNLLLIGLASPLALLPTAQWLAWGIGTFVVGWVIQFVGHYYEGKKPAFVDDISGLFVGPMFVVAEVLFALGWGRELLQSIERAVGPTHLRDLHPQPTR
jgi:uncharacterized membrane protein YGL010W